MNSPVPGSLRKFHAVYIGWLFSLAATSSLAQSAGEKYVFSHFAGPLGGPDYVDGTGADARFNNPRAIAADRAGNLYVTDQGNYAIRKITPTGVVTTLALFDDTGKPVRLLFTGIAVDSTGTLYVTGGYSDSIHKITSSGVVATLAGAPYTHYYYDRTARGESRDGTGADARFFIPAGLAVDSAGNIYVADTGNYTVRKITPGGVVTTVAGTAGQKGETDGTGANARFTGPYGIKLDNAGNILVADQTRIRKITPEGVVTTLAGKTEMEGTADGTSASARFSTATDLVLDSLGNLYVADPINRTIHKITPGGVLTTVAGAKEQIGSVDGAGATARFRNPAGLAIDSADNVFVADSGNHSIRKITSVGLVTTFASTASGLGTDDGTWTAARFHGPRGIAIDSGGTIYVADTENSVIRKISPAGIVTTLTTSGASGSFYRPTSIAVDSSGNVYVTNWLGIKKIAPDGTVSTLPSGFNDGNGLAVDDVGNIYYTYGSAINKLTPMGTVTTLAGMNFAGVGVHYADGTGTDARFDYPGGLVVDAAGNLFVADSGNHKIRKITPDGVVTTLPVTVNLRATTNTGGLAIDGAGNLYLTDPWNCAVTKITPGGAVSIIGGTDGILGCADGIGSAARFNYPSGIAVDRAGNVYVADTENHAIRKGQLAGPPVITTQPQSQSTIVGASVQLSVTASGVPSPTYQWYVNSSPFNGATTNTLSFTNARSSDAGDYAVVVTNELGTVTSSKATLTVSSTPAPTSPPTSGGNGSGGGSVEGWMVVALFAFSIARMLNLRHGPKETPSS